MVIGTRVLIMTDSFFKMFSSGKDSLSLEDDDALNDAIQSRDQTDLNLKDDITVSTASEQSSNESEDESQTLIGERLISDIEVEDVPIIDQAKLDIQTLKSREPDMQNQRNELKRSEELRRSTTSDSGLTSTRQDIETSAILGPKTVFKGELSGSEDVVIHGVFEGNIDLENNKVYVGKSARVTGDISAKNILISGLVEGEMYGQESIVIHSSSQVVGKIKADSVTLEDGAKFRGSIEMDFGFGENVAAKNSAKKNIEPPLVTAEDNAHRSYKSNDAKSQEKLERLKGLEKKKNRNQNQANSQEAVTD